MGGSRWPKNDESSGATMMTSDKDDEWQWGTSVIEKQRGGGRSKEKDERLEVTHTERHGHSPVTRSGAKVVANFGDEDGDGGTILFWGQRREHDVERLEAILKVVMMQAEDLQRRHNPTRTSFGGSWFLGEFRQDEIKIGETDVELLARNSRQAL